jgi:hypothetical protein
MVSKRPISEEVNEQGCADRRARADATREEGVPFAQLFIVLCGFVGSIGGAKGGWRYGVGWPALGAVIGLPAGFLLCAASVFAYPVIFLLILEKTWDG